MSNATTSPTIELSPQEAEAVLELWARKQAEGELRSRLNVQDLAEAMSLPVSEVEKMVATVRQKAASPQTVSSIKKAKPVNRPLIALAIVVWFCILGGACFFAYEAGLNKGQPTYGLPAPPPPAEVVDIAVAPSADTMAIPTAASSGFETPVHSIPRSVSLEFKGYKVYGEQKTNTSEQAILSALHQIVDEIAPSSSAEQDVKYGDLSIVEALQTNDGSKIGGQIQFETFIVRGDRNAMSQQIPIAKVADESLVRLVTQEQRTRLKILANWAYNQRAKGALARP